MPFYPEALFELSGRDRQVTWLDPAFYGPVGATLTGALRSVTIGTDGSVSQQVPDGRALLLQHVCAYFAPGTAANNCSLQRILVRPPTALTLEMWLREQRIEAADVDAAQGYELTWQGSLIVPPLWFVQAYGEFSAGADNEVAINIAGMLIPVGNFARV